MVLDELREVNRLLDSLHGADRSELAGEEALQAVWQLKNRTDALVTKVTSVFDDSGEWQAHRAKNAAGYVSWLTHQPLGLTRSVVRQGKKLKDMSYVADAFSNGEIGAEHVAVLAKAHNKATAAAFADEEKKLVEEAMFSRFKKFKERLGYWYARTDPDSAERNFKEETDRRSFRYAKVLDMFYGDFRLDPIGGEIFWTALRQIEAELFEADWAEARARLGDAACEKDLCRTASQRLADALVEMATRAMAMPADARRPEPLFTILVGFETWAGPVCETLSGSIVPPSLFAQWIDRAWIERIVFDGPSRVIDVGERQRMFRGATRRAVEVRDRECYHPMCEEPIERCQVDHVIPYAMGGPTIVANGRLACGYHNRLRNQRDGPAP